MNQLASAEAVLASARRERAFSAVSAEIGRASGPIWTHAAGTLGYDSATAVTPSTIFDIASLTKVLATTTCALGLSATRALNVDIPVRSIVREWKGADRDDATLRDLMEHASGLPPHREYFRRIEGRAAFVAAIAAEPLDYPRRERSVYSDLGFILLGVALERIAGRSLDEQWRSWRSSAGIDGPLTFLPPGDWKPRTAMTEQDDWRGRMLQGEVHDQNAAALGGVAAHAGLFGTAAAVGEVARWWLQRLNGIDDHATGIPASCARAYVQRSTVPGSSRALGWDTMLVTSSCGTRMSARAVGHTGFTGTSLWIDPELNLYFVLLTNRVHPTRRNSEIQKIRRAFHDAALNDIAHDSDNH